MDIQNIETQNSVASELENNGDSAAFYHRRHNASQLQILKAKWWIEYSDIPGQITYQVFLLAMV